MFTYEELQPQAQANAISLVKQLSFNSGEWLHILNTARQIKLGLLEVLEQADELAEIGSLSQLLKADELEQLEQFKDFDMPASIRTAAQFLNNLADDHCTICDAADAIKESLQGEITAYWANEFNSEYTVLDSIEEWEVKFNSDGAIAGHNLELCTPNTFNYVWKTENSELDFAVKAPEVLRDTAGQLATIFHWNNRDSNNLTIGAVISKLLELNQTSLITSDDGLKVSFTAIENPESNAKQFKAIDMTVLLADVADCLSYSENVDNFTATQHYNQLKKLEPITAAFLAYAQDLYMRDAVCDSSSVKNEHVYIFVEWLSHSNKTNKLKEIQSLITDAVTLQDASLLNDQNGSFFKIEEIEKVGNYQRVCVSIDITKVSPPIKLEDSHFYACDSCGGNMLSAIFDERPCPYCSDVEESDDTE